MQISIKSEGEKNAPEVGIFANIELFSIFTCSKHSKALQSTIISSGAKNIYIKMTAFAPLRGFAKVTHLNTGHEQTQANRICYFLVLGVFLFSK